LATSCTAEELWFDSQQMHEMSLTHPASYLLHAGVSFHGSTTVKWMKLAFTFT
jgi:hypothetical protein